MRAIASRRKRARTMFRKTTGTILCPSCGRLTTADAEACLVCGRRHPGMWGFAAPLRALFGRHSFTNVVTVACIALYVASLLLDPRAATSARGPFDAFSPSTGALLALGAAGTYPWSLGHWWTILTGIYLHGAPDVRPQLLHAGCEQRRARGRSRGRSPRGLCRVARRTAAGDGPRLGAGRGVHRRDARRLRPLALVDVRRLKPSEQRAERRPRPAKRAQRGN